MMYPMSWFLFSFFIGLFISHEMEEFSALTFMSTKKSLIFKNTKWNW